MKNQICTILGGGGFIGRYLVRNLTKKNYRCFITTRKAFQKGYLKTQATPGAIELIDWNPDNFFELLTKNNVNVIKKLIYPDHYMLSKKELLNIIKDSKLKNCTVVMTEKDYFRIKDYNLENIYYLKLGLKIDEKAKFINQILKIYD